MVFAIEREVENKQLSDQEFVKGLVEEILPKVDQARQTKSLQGEYAKSVAVADELPIGGNIEQQQASGAAVIGALCSKLKTMNSREADLSTVDYICIERVLAFLIRRGEDYQQKLNRLTELRQKYETKN